MKKLIPPPSNDDRTRLYVSLLLIVPYTLLILLMPFVPNVREALVILGPAVGYALRYLFEPQRSDS